jgi:hypothetical protein
VPYYGILVLKNYGRLALYVNSTLLVATPRKNVCACVGHKKDGEEFKCQIVNKNMAI